MQKPEVSVVTGTRNRPSLVKRALSSIASQRFQDYEVLVVDDGSSEENLAAYPAVFDGLDERFRLIRPLAPGAKGSGPGLTRNRGIEAGRGTFVAFLDDDDVWTDPDHLSRAIAALSDTGCDLYCANMQGNRGDDVLIPSWFQDSQHLQQGPALANHPDVRRTNRAAFLEAVLRRTPHPNSMVMTRHLLERTGAFPEWVRTAEDLCFILRLLDSVDELLVSNRVMARYRLPEGDAISLQYPRVEETLNHLFVAQFMSARANSNEVRVAARKIEAWSLRQLSKSMKDSGRQGKAIGLVLQALAVYPTAGTLWQLARTLGPRGARSTFEQAVP